MERIEDTGSHINLLGDELRKRVIGQAPAIDAVETAMEKARLREEGRPVASLMFLGPTGVGKTELATALADIMAVDKLHPPLLKIDCGQYQQPHMMVNLIGAPKSYVGYGDSPVLDKDLIEQPGSVVLFDEIEKGHPALHNLLLQITDKGTVKLSGGDEVNFSNATVIMTSNVGASEMRDVAEHKGIGFPTSTGEVDQSRIESAATRALKRRFSPEFINRLDGVITFNSLSDEQLVEVLDTHVEKANYRYQRLGNIALTLTGDLKSHLVDTAEGRREYGFRPVKRNYEKNVETMLSRFVAKQLVGGREVIADYEDEVTFYQGEELPSDKVTIADILGMEEEDFFEPGCETDELLPLPENVTPIREKK